MKYALIKNGIVENCIEYDDEKIKADLVRYEEEIASYEKAEAQFDVEWKSYTKKLKPLYDSILENYNEPDEDDPNTLVLTEEGQHIYQAQKDKIRPKHPGKRPSRPLGQYTPPEGYEMVELEPGFGIGDKYENGKFIKPEA